MDTTNHNAAAAIPRTAPIPSSPLPHSTVDPDLISTLVELHRQRVALHKSEKSLTLQIKALCRRLVGGSTKEADTLYRSMLNGQGHELAMHAAAVTAPFVQARAVINESRAQAEKGLAQHAKLLPVWQWVDGVRGFGPGSLAAIVGEAGDIGTYSNPAKLWKRMGLAVIGDSRQRKVAGADAIEHGYSPRRRSVMWVIGDSLIKTSIRVVRDDDGNDTGERSSLSEYGQIYIDRKAYERPRVETDGHAHARAKRYMEKRLLRDLWRAWRIAS